MIASDVITIARQGLSDTSEEYRFSDSEMLDALTSATERLGIDRPDLLVDSAGAIIAVVDVTALGDTLIFDREWLEALADYLCYLIFMKDNTHTFNAEQSAIRIASYKNAIN